MMRRVPTGSRVKAYLLIFRYSVLFAMPSCAAAWVRLPSLCRIAVRIDSASAISSEHTFWRASSTPGGGDDAAGRAPRRNAQSRTSGGSSFTVIAPSWP